MVRILICGLPTSGKTTLAGELRNKFLHEGIPVAWINADNLRRIYNDWDFSMEGRIRQAKRIAELASHSNGFVIADFIAPTEKIREIYKPHYTIWMNTIEKSAYEDTNAIFEEPQNVDFIVLEKNAKKVVKVVYEEILQLKQTNV